MSRRFESLRTSDSDVDARRARHSTPRSQRRRSGILVSSHILIPLLCVDVTLNREVIHVGPTRGGIKVSTNRDAASTLLDSPLSYLLRMNDFRRLRL